MDEIGRRARARAATPARGDPAPGPRARAVVPDAAWARRETAERVGDEAGQAAARRGELRGLEAGLAADVVDLTELHDRRAARWARPRAGIRMRHLPVQGPGVVRRRRRGLLLRPRAARRRDRRAARRARALLAVVGPSGSGKSSGVRAGPAAGAGGGRAPRQRALGDRSLLRPGEHPLAALEQRGWRAVVSDRRVVVAVDQFEETVHGVPR